MGDKAQMLAALRAEFERWEELLAGLSEEQITSRQLPDGQSIKDVIGHLRAWQQLSIARLEAALAGGEPVLPDWLEGRDPEAEEYTDQFNATIYGIYRDEPWSRVYSLWRDGFLRFLHLAEQIPAPALMDAARHPWLKGNPLYAVLEGSYEHHHIEHREPLRAWLAGERDASAGEP